MTDFKNRLLAPYNGLKVTWFNGWHPVFDDALRTLPESETCPHDLFRLLIQNPGSAPKRVALVTRQGEPVAVVPLRQLGRSYYEIATWMIPGTVFPARPNDLARVLDALGCEIWVTWRRMGGPPPPSPLLRYLKTTPVHVIQLSTDYEQYWRETDNWKTVKNKRNRCKDFELAKNLPGMAEWTIKNATEKWRDGQANTSRAVEDWAVSDWIVIANYLEQQGRHYTLTLLDQGNPIGGATLIAHGNDLIGGLIYRKPEYEWHGVGVRLLDLSVSFAAEAGFATVDMGGAADYKKHWAPEAGELWHYKLCPEPLFWAKETVKSLRSWIRDGRGQMNEGGEL